MARTKKITNKEFIELIIDKELEIANAPIRYKDLIAMTKEEQEKFKFYTKYTFKTLDEYLEWKNFFMEHIYDWLPKRTNKTECEREFAYTNLMWGLKYDFNYDLINLYNNELYRELEDIFIEYYPQYDRNKLDDNEISIIKEILYFFETNFNKKTLKKEIKGFITEHSESLNNFFEGPRTNVFYLPVILLLLYGLAKKQNFIINHWMLNESDLKDCLKILNISGIS